jgi:hypothetical protein
VDLVLLLVAVHISGRRRWLALLVVYWCLLNVVLPAVLAVRYLADPPLGIVLFLVVYRVGELELVAFRRWFLWLWEPD